NGPIARRGVLILLARNACARGVIDDATPTLGPWADVRTHSIRRASRRSVSTARIDPLVPKAREQRRCQPDRSRAGGKARQVARRVAERCSVAGRRLPFGQ